jgi:hypothetical protein
MSAQRRALLVGLTAAAVCWGCGTSQPQTSSPPIKPSLSSQSSLFVTMDIPKALKQLTSTTFAVHVASASTDKPIIGAAVSVALTMPSMLMPPNVVPCHQIAPGYYRGAGTFTMSGDWRVTATVAEGKTTAKLSQTVSVQ